MIEPLCLEGIVWTAEKVGKLHATMLLLCGRAIEARDLEAAQALSRVCHLLDHYSDNINVRKGNA